MIITDPVHADLRTAINIKNALDRINELPKLGYCPTKVQEFRSNFELDDRDDSSSTTEEGDRDLANQANKNLILVYGMYLTVYTGHP